MIYRVNHKIIHIIHRFWVISYVNHTLSSRTFILWIFPSDIMSYPEYRILRQHSLHFQNTHRLHLTLHIRCQAAANTKRAAVPGSPMRSYLLFYHSVDRTEAYNAFPSNATKFHNSKAL